jgi:hypothetical protein
MEPEGCDVTYLLTCLLTYSMEQSPSWEANRFAASQEIPRVLWNPKVVTLLTYLLTPWSRVLLEKLTDLQPVKKSSTFSGNRKVITAFYKSPPPVPIQRINPSSRQLKTTRNMVMFWRWGVISTSPNCQAGDPPFVGCPRLIIQYILQLRSISGGRFSIPNPTTPHAVVTATHWVSQESVSKPIQVHIRDVTISLCSLSVDSNNTTNSHLLKALARIRFTVLAGGSYVNHL